MPTPRNRKDQKESVKNHLLKEHRFIT